MKQNYKCNEEILKKKQNWRELQHTGCLARGVYISSKTHFVTETFQFISIELQYGTSIISN